MAIKYRPIKPRDYKPVRQFLSGLGWQSRVQDPARFRKMMERSDRTVVAFEGSHVIGFGRALCDGISNGYISMVAVAMDKRRQGIGKELVGRLMAESDGENVTWVLRAGRDSSRFWKKLGFAESKIAMERIRRSREVS
jgi:N-acetylglutamate synthase-like GNAT family acetyltransferase